MAPPWSDVPHPSPTVPLLPSLSQSEMELCSLTSQFEDFVLQLLDRYAVSAVCLMCDSDSVSVAPPEPHSHVVMHDDRLCN